MKNKGFTLIELLAVIVILAIIALIASPVILGIINDARNSAKERSAELIVNSVSTAYANAYMKASGSEPTLTAVAEQLQSVLGGSVKSAGDIVASGNAVNSTLTVTTKDSVTCTFKLGTDKKLLLVANDGDDAGEMCGGSYTDTATVSIGTLSA